MRPRKEEDSTASEQELTLTEGDALKFTTRGRSVTDSLFPHLVTLGFVALHDIVTENRKLEIWRTAYKVKYIKKWRKDVSSRPCDTGFSLCVLVPGLSNPTRSVSISINSFSFLESLCLLREWVQYISFRMNLLPFNVSAACSSRLRDLIKCVS